MTRSKMIKRLGLITGGIFIASATTLAGFGIGILGGMHARDPLAQMVEGTLENMYPELAKALNIALPSIAGVAGLFLLCLGARHYYIDSVANDEYWAHNTSNKKRHSNNWDTNLDDQDKPHFHKDEPSMGGPIIMITGTSLMTFGLCGGLGQLIEQATVEQANAILISAGVLAGLAAIVFTASYLLAARYNDF